MKVICNELVNSRWFSVADLLIVLGSGVLWYRYPRFGWIILILALLPKAIRVFAGKMPFKSTVFDLPIAVFLVTALLGAWMAYNLQESFAKFWLVLGSVLLYYSLASQKQENTWLLISFATCFGVGLAVTFLLVYDWQANPVSSDLANQVGAAWMKVRPSLPFTIKDDDFISDILLVLFPFPLALFHYARRGKSKFWWLQGFAIFSIIIYLLGLSMASILMAFTTFIVICGLVIWWAVYRIILKSAEGLLPKIYLGLSGLAFIFFLTVLVKFPDQLLRLAQHIPPLARFENRISVDINSIHLVQDFLFTGGGLGTFAGLYSKYILSIPYFFIPICSSLFLQIALEQGIVGSLAFSSVLVGGGFILLMGFIRNKVQSDKLAITYLIFAGFIILAVVGLIDAMLFTGYGTYFLFVMPGFFVFLMDDQTKNVVTRNLPDILFGVSIVIFILSLGGKFFSSYYANIGALEMARVDLGGWTWEKRMESKTFSAYAPATQFFRMAKQIDDLNSTSNYRLGLIAAGRDDFIESCQYLKKAIVVQPAHRGVIKNLGYCLLWRGYVNESLPYLQMIPEAQEELNTYIWWWNNQNRNDLSGYANQMALKLNSH